MSSVIYNQVPFVCARSSTPRQHSETKRKPSDGRLHPHFPSYSGEAEFSFWGRPIPLILAGNRRRNAEPPSVYPENYG